MSQHLANYGQLDLTLVCSKCDLCGNVGSGFQLTGPHGYITTCKACLRYFLPPELENSSLLKALGLEVYPADSATMDYLRPTIEAGLKALDHTIAHAPGCPVASGTWTACNCGLFAGYGKPLTRDGDHADTCPCHCVCDFGKRLSDYFNGPTG